MAEVKFDNQDSGGDHDLGGSDLAPCGQIDGVKPGQTEHSAMALREVPAGHSVRRPQRPAPKGQPVEKKDNVVQLSAQRGIVFDRANWKRSRNKVGYLIRRIEGYSIAETEYGVSYLWVLSRKPDLTTADNSVYPFAGYFNWKSLEASGLLCKERRNANRDKAAIG